MAYGRYTQCKNKPHSLNIDKFKRKHCLLQKKNKENYLVESTVHFSLQATKKSCDRKRVIKPNITCNVFTNFNSALCQLNFGLFCFSTPDC